MGCSRPDDLEAQGASPSASEEPRKVPKGCCADFVCIAVGVLQVLVGLLLLLRDFLRVLGGDSPAGVLEIFGACLLFLGPPLALMPLLCPRGLRCCCCGWLGHRRGAVGRSARDAERDRFNYILEVPSTGSDSSPGSLESIESDVAQQPQIGEFDDAHGGPLVEGGCLSGAVRAVLEDHLQGSVDRLVSAQLSPSQGALLQRYSAHLSSQALKIVAVLSAAATNSQSQVSAQELGGLLDSAARHASTPRKAVPHTPLGGTPLRTTKSKKVVQKKLVELTDQEILGLYQGAQEEAQIEADWRGIDEWPATRSAWHQHTSDALDSNPGAGGDAHNYLQMLSSALQDSSCPISPLVDDAYPVLTPNVGNGVETKDVLCDLNSSYSSSLATPLPDLEASVSRSPSFAVPRTPTEHVLADVDLNLCCSASNSPRKWTPGKPLPRAPAPQSSPTAPRTNGPAAPRSSPAAPRSL